MGALATTVPRPPGAKRERRTLAHRHATQLSEPGRATLEDRITSVWTELVETGTADCPVCAAKLAAGRPCGSCGSELN